MANKPSHNLIEDGIDSCADYIMRAISKKSVPFKVFVDPSGWIRVRTLVDYNYGAVKDRPEHEFVCTYQKKTACLEYIREDLNSKLEQIWRHALQKAA